MPTPTRQQESFLVQLRLLAEELCCDLCRFEHVKGDGCCPEDVQLEREFYLGTPGAFADIRVVPPTGSAYFVEVKIGYSSDVLLRHLRRKYGPDTPGAALGSKLVLVIDAAAHTNWPAMQAELTRALRPGLALEVWDEQRLGAIIRERFHIDLESVTAGNLLDVRQAIDRAKGFDAFGGPSFAAYEHDPLKAQLMWHFGFWRLRQLRDAGRATPRDILPPDTYRSVIVLLADLCSFSSYVRDTPDSDITQESLTSFYSKARYQIINSGGMLYQFVGDEVIGLFGIPEQDPAAVTRAIATAKALVSIGESVSQHWQRRIDRVQTSGGVHIGMALGDLQFVSLRPFSRTHMGAVGDCINVAARLMTVAGQAEIVVSNALYRTLSEEEQGSFREVEPVEGRNVGRIKAWKLHRDPATWTWQKPEGG